MASIPAEDDIENVSVAVFEAGLWREQIPEFVIPRKDFTQVLRWFSHSRLTRDPPIFPADPTGELKFPNDRLGVVRIATKSGEKITIEVYWTGKNPLVFTLNGKDYYYGNESDPEGQPVGDGGICFALTVAKVHSSGTPLK
jgi:hypothetical protein